MRGVTAPRTPFQTMCAINPKHKYSFRLDIYTAHGTRKEFDAMLDDVRTELLELEIKLNTKLKLRVHISE